MFDFLPTFNKKNQEKIYDIDAIAKLLKTTPEALRAFEKMYKKRFLISLILQEIFFIQILVKPLG